MKYALGGRTYRPIGESTIEHDLAFMGIVRKAGLDLPSLHPGETPQEFATRLLGDLAASGQALELLGCLLLPDELASEDWTPAVAKATVAHLSGLTARTDKDLIQALTISAVLDFLERGYVCSRNTQTSWPARTAPIQPRRPRRGGGRGMSWFARLRKTIGSVWRGSRAGRSGKRSKPTGSVSVIALSVPGSSSS